MVIEERCALLNITHCCQTSLQGPEEKFLFIYFFPVLLAFSLFGNGMNIVLYHHPFLNSSSTVRLLLFRAVANLLFSVSLIPNYIYSLNNAQRQPYMPYTVRQTDTIEIFYWSTLKFVMFASNVLNTISVWLTVCVTCQLLALVVWPVMAKNSLSMEMARWMVAVVFVLSTLLHILLLTHRDVKKSACPADNAIVVHHYLSLSKPSVDQVFYYIQATFVNIVPLLILIVCCLAMGWNAFKRRKTSVLTTKKTGRTECVLHLAAATTFCHLVFEFPSTAVQLLASVSSILGMQFFTLIAVTNFLTIFNASLPFVIYTTCSRRYRQLAFHMCCFRSARFRIPIEDAPHHKHDSQALITKFSVNLS